MFVIILECPIHSYTQKSTKVEFRKQLNERLKKKNTQLKFFEILKFLNPAYSSAFRWDEIYLLIQNPEPRQCWSNLYYSQTPNPDELCQEGLPNKHIISDVRWILAHKNTRHCIKGCGRLVMHSKLKHTWQENGIITR